VFGLSIRLVEGFKPSTRMTREGPGGEVLAGLVIQMEWDEEWRRERELKWVRLGLEMRVLPIGVRWLELFRS
jgi:hypothetical protein